MRHAKVSPQFATTGDRSPVRDLAALPTWPMHACTGLLQERDRDTYGDALIANIAAIVGAFPPAERAAIMAWASTLYLHQLDLAFDPWQFSILNKSRKIGATYSYAGAAVLWAMLGEPTVVVSLGEDEACEVIDDARKHAAFMMSEGSTLAETEGNKKELVFPNTGGRIVARPHTGAGRSFSGNVILDEFAYHQDPEAVWDAAGAVAAMGYRIRVLSTPNGIGNLFHTMFTDDDAHRGYRVMQMSLAFARAAGMVLHPTDAECWAMARNNPRVFDQMFGCAFLDANEQYLPHALVSAASIATIKQLARLTNMPEYAGVDVARRHDLFVIARAICDMDSSCIGLDGVQRKGPVLWVPPMITCKRTDWVRQRALVAAGFEEHKWKRLCVDGTGIGMETSERMQRRHGSQRVEIVEFTLQAKEDMATRLYEWFQEGRIRLMREDTELRRDLYSLRRIITAAGNVRYDAARTKDGHADRAWALALACLAAARHFIGYDDDGHTVADDMAALQAADDAVYREHKHGSFDEAELEDEGDGYE